MFGMNFHKTFGPLFIEMMKVWVSKIIVLVQAIKESRNSPLPLPAGPLISFWSTSGPGKTASGALAFPLGNLPKVKTTSLEKLNFGWYFSGLDSRRVA
jgi:hypothetical protein